MLLSFVIPVYNGEKYIEKCLDSLLTQDISSDQYEIICVDDFSTDNSKKIVKSYVDNHTNIVHICQPKNTKTGTVCNIGLDRAKGKYIWFIGQDDWIEKNSLRSLIDKCESDNLDVLTFNYNRIDENGEPLHSAEVFKNSDILNGVKYIEKYFDKDFEHYLLGYEWRAIFKKEFLYSKNIRFQDWVIYEDTVILFKSIFYADRIASINSFIYNYRVNSYSITDVNKRYKGFLIYEFAFVAGKEVRDLALEIKNIHPLYFQVLYKKSIWYFQSFTYKVVGASIKEKRVFYKEVRTNKKYIFTLLQQTKWYVKLLANPYIGIIVSVLLKPMYVLKQKIFNRNRLDWSY